MIDCLKGTAEHNGYPIDGMVLGYDDVSYGESLGMTGHHLRSQIAFKFYDEEVETTLKGIDWTMGKTGVLTPTAIFEPVEIDGTTVERASLHNISILSDVLGVTPHIGQKITVYKANQIIPQVLNADKKSNYNNVLFIPLRCPICGGNTEVKQENNSQVLICANDNCNGKLLGKLVHFVSKNAMNIDGLSEARLEKFINKGWLNSFKDVMNIKDYYYLIAVLDGFGAKSARKLIDAIEASKNTTLDRFIYSLCIPLIGRSASKTISKYFDGSFERFYNEGCLNYFVFENLEGFGVEMSDSIRKYLNTNIKMIKELADILTFEIPKNEVVPQNINLVGKTFVITGSLNTFANRDAAKEQIEALGGKVSGSVSAKTSYLVNNDIDSTSGKNKKAKELGVPIITEEDLINMMKYF
jgi:DNA ligase (NAD+)